MVYNLKITLKEGQVRNVYLDVRSILEIKETGFFIQGILFPFLIEQKEGDEESQSTYLKKIELDVPIADSIFTIAAASPHENAK